MNDNNAMSQYVLKNIIDICEVEQIYVVNLTHRLDRLIKFNQQFIKMGLKYKIIEGVNARSSFLCQQKFQNLLLMKKNDHKSSELLSDWDFNVLKRRSTVATIGYIESQRLVLKDALAHNYKKIMVFDDDSIINLYPQKIDLDFTENLKNSKIFLAGCSEYSQEDEVTYLDSHKQFYHPIPGKTCGSFAVIYDHTVFKELLELIDEASGPYDNCMLGYIYKKYPDECYATRNHLVIADVSESEIRGSRNQIEHSENKNWDVNSWRRYHSPVIISIILDNPAIINEITNLQLHLGKNIFLNFYFISTEGLRPFHPGSIPLAYSEHNYIDAQADDEFYNNINQNNIRQKLEEINLPFSEIAVLWREKKLNFNYLSQILRLIISSNDLYGQYNNSKWAKQCGKTYIKGLHSVIIPTMRDIKSIMPSLFSVLNQNKEDIEIILVNDNPQRKISSTEIEKYFIYDKINYSKYLKVINHSKNMNGSAARNTGLLASNGEFISFLDDDDIYENSRISKLQQALENINDNQIGAVYCAYQKRNESKEIDNERLISGTLQSNIIKLEYDKHYVHTNTVTFKRGFILAINGFDEYFERHQDIELMTRFFMHFHVHPVKYLGVSLKPANVNRTFNPSLENLLNVKIKYLSNFKLLLKKNYSRYVRDIAKIHTKDILKYFKNYNKDLEERIYLILLKCMIDDIYIL